MAPVTSYMMAVQFQSEGGEISGSISTNMPGLKASDIIQSMLPDSLVPPFMLPDVAMLLSGPVMSPFEMADEQEEEEEAPPMHPCGREISACQDTGARERTAIEECLVAHFAQLSDSCQCFVRQTVRTPPPVPHRPSPSAAPAAIALHSSREHARHTDVRHAASAKAANSPAPHGGEKAPPLHPLHQLSCLFLLTSLLLGIFLAIRCLVTAICAPPKVVKKIALVPPASSGVRVDRKVAAQQPAAAVQTAERLVVKV